MTKKKQNLKRKVTLTFTGMLSKKKKKKKFSLVKKADTANTQS